MTITAVIQAWLFPRSGMFLAGSGWQDRVLLFDLNRAATGINTHCLIGQKI